MAGSNHAAVASPYLNPAVSTSGWNLDQPLRKLIVPWRRAATKAQPVRFRIATKAIGETAMGFWRRIKQALLTDDGSASIFAGLTARWASFEEPGFTSQFETRYKPDNRTKPNEARVLARSPRKSFSR